MPEGHTDELLRTMFALDDDLAARWWACYEPERPADMKVCYLLTCSKCHTKARLDLITAPTFMAEGFGTGGGAAWLEFTEWAMGPMPA